MANPNNGEQNEVVDDIYDDSDVTDEEEEDNEEVKKEQSYNGSVSFTTSVHNNYIIDIGNGLFFICVFTIAIASVCYIVK